jgi:DedD protein
MATTTSNEASEIRRRGRQRLIGAVAIVLLLVVFVPMVLDSEPRPSRNEPSLTIPPKDNPPPLPMPAPEASTKAPHPAKAPEPAKIEPLKAEPAKVEPAKPAEPPKAAGAGTQGAMRGVTPPPAAKTAPPPRLEGFAVQVGAFRDDEKLRQAREKLTGAGIAHYTERLDNPQGALTRLRAGPFPTREAADAAAAKLRGISIQGQVVPLP